MRNEFLPARYGYLVTDAVLYIAGYSYGDPDAGIGSTLDVERADRTGVRIYLPVDVNLYGEGDPGSGISVDGEIYELSDAEFTAVLALADAASDYAPADLTPDGLIRVERPE